MKKLFFILISVCCFYPGCQKKSNFVTHNFPKSQWIGGLNDIFNGMKLHLNNFTSTKHQYEQDDNYAYEYQSQVFIGHSDRSYFSSLKPSEIRCNGAFHSNKRQGRVVLDYNGSVTGSKAYGL